MHSEKSGPSGGGSAHRTRGLEQHKGRHRRQSSSVS